MSVKFSSFDAMTRQNKITALMHIKEVGNQKREDYYLALHALLDSEIQVSLAAKMIVATFSGKPWVQDFGPTSSPDFREKISQFLRHRFGFGPELIELDHEPNRQLLAQNLQKKQKKFETLQEWDGPFPASVRILNSLREDTQQLVAKMLNDGENLEKTYLCFYNEVLQPFRDCQKSLDGAAAATIVNFARIHNPGKVSPIIQPMFEKLSRPIYLLAIITNRRGFLFLRDELKSSQAAVVAFNLQSVISVKTVKEGQLINIEIETPQDFITLPMLEPNDAYEAGSILRQKSVEAIEADEEFIDRDFDNELRKLDMLFRAKAINNSEYIFRKSRLQKMELEKFSDANIELLLSKRFSDSKLGEKFDQQLLKKFTFEKTVMFTDIVGFSSAASQKMLLDTMTLLAVHDKLLMPVIEEKQGTLIKKIGDALMIRFDDPIAACTAAIEMQQRLADFNQKSQEKIFIRIGLNTGTVFVKNEDVFGDAVNVAARMESLAKPGMIFITEATHEKVCHEIHCTDLGGRMIKGKSEPIHVYSISDGSEGGQKMVELANRLMEQAGLKKDESLPQPELTTDKPVRQKPSAMPLPDLADLADLKPNQAAVTTNQTEKVSAQKFRPADETKEEAEPIRDPVLEMICAIDSARQNYILAVRNGSKRQAELEDWFARYEEFIKPRLDL